MLAKARKSSFHANIGEFCSVTLACVASVSSRVRRESWEESKRKKKGMTGEGEANEGNACPQTPRF